MENNFDIIYLQNQCLMEYAERKKMNITMASKLFEKYNIFKYIRDCFDYIHLSGIDFIVNDIDSRIQRSDRFD